MSYCTQCGKANNDTAKFCTACGATITVANDNTSDSRSAQNNVFGNTSQKGIYWVIGVVILIGATGLGIYSLYFTKKSTNNVSQRVEKAKRIEADTINKQLTEQKIMNFLNEWLIAQNNKNLATYASFYDQSFQGIKRVKSGRTFYYNHDDWINDRTKMYSSALNLSVTASNIRISNKDGITTQIRFTSGYSSDVYKDIGEKELIVKMGANGKISILREEMLESNAHL